MTARKPPPAAARRSTHHTGSSASPSATVSHAGHSHGPDPALLKRLARVEGQVRGVAGMVQDGRYCVDILTQMAAIHQALRGVSRAILERHMQTCVADALQSRRPQEAERVSREMAELLDRFTR